MEQLRGRIGAACRRFADRGAWPADRVCGDDTTRARRCSCDGGGLHRARHYRCAALRMAAARWTPECTTVAPGPPFLGSLWTVPARTCRRRTMARAPASVTRVAWAAAATAAAARQLNGRARGSAGWLSLAASYALVKTRRRAALIIAPPPRPPAQPPNLQDKRMRVKPFVRFINYNHIMPTRYNLDVSAAAPPPLRQARVRRSALLLPLPPPLPPYRTRWRCRSWRPRRRWAATPLPALPPPLCAHPPHTLARPPPTARPRATARAGV